MRRADGEHVGLTVAGNKQL